jgi:CO/xanthine dehydrogenase Mo-binding subunit
MVAFTVDAQHGQVGADGTSNIGRRDFLKATAAGLTFALTLAADPSSITGEAAADTPLAPNLWVTIATDGTITIVSPPAEMGQGTFTTLAAVLADELDADWSQVRLVSPPAWDEKTYGNPEFFNFLHTVASMATRGYFKPMRIAGAQARRVLLDAVAARWSVAVGELSTEPSVVVHAASGRRIRYGDIADFAKAPPELPRIEDKQLKSPASFRYIGKDLPRVDVAAKVTGTTKYGIDVQVPGMLYAAVLHVPYFGGAPVAVDDAAARRVPGITEVVRTRARGVRGHRARQEPPGPALPARGRCQSRHGGRRQSVPGRIPHPLCLSRRDGTPECDRFCEPRRQVGRDLGRHAVSDQRAQPGRAFARDRTIAHHLPPAFPGRRIRSSRVRAGRRA